MADETIRINLDIEPDPNAVNKTNRGLDSIEKNLEDIEKQANQTRDKMEKLAQVGSKIAVIGAAITAPFLVAMQKYASQADKNERTAQRIAAVSARWENTQMRIGKITADIVLPTLEKALTIVEKIADFAEQNPGAVKAALGIGASLAVLGGIVATTAQIVSTIATVQGLAASAGIALGGGTAAAGAGAGVAGAGAAGAAGLGAALTGILTSPAVVGAFAVAIGASVGKFIGEALLGREVTWAEIGDTLGKMLIIVAQGWDDIFGFFGGDTDFAGAVARGVGIPLREKDARDGARAAATLQTIAASGTATGNAINLLAQVLSFGFDDIAKALGDGFANLFGSRAGGGYAPYGPYMLGDSASGGRGAAEYVLNSQTTRAAESIIGGKLTQEKVMSAMITANFSNGLTMRSAQKMIQANNTQLLDTFAGAF